jgi:predicted negative regulator of RcsB-dependent stress response
MFNFIKRRLKNNKGAMDKILVTLLFVIIGVGAVAGLKTWIDGQKDSIVESANGYITNAK